MDWIIESIWIFSWLLWAHPPLAFFWGECPCCGGLCSYCTSGTTPEEIKITISGAASFFSVCADCNDLNGDYLLARDEDDNCKWSLISADSCEVLSHTLVLEEDRFLYTLDVDDANPIETRWQASVVTPVDCSVTRLMAETVADGPRHDCFWDNASVTMTPTPL